MQSLGYDIQAWFSCLCIHSDCADFIEMKYRGKSLWNTQPTIALQTVSTGVNKLTKAVNRERMMLFIVHVNT